MTLGLTGNVELGALAENTVLKDTVEEAAEEAAVGGSTGNLGLGAARDGLAGAARALGLGDGHGGEGVAGDEVHARLGSSGGGGQEESKRREGVHFESRLLGLEKTGKVGSGVGSVGSERLCERLFVMLDAGEMNRTEHRDGR